MAERKGFLERASEKGLKAYAGFNAVGAVALAGAGVVAENTGFVIEIGNLSLGPEVAYFLAGVNAVQAVAALGLEKFIKSRKSKKASKSSFALAA